MGENPLSIGDWLRLAAEKERAAKMLLSDPTVSRQAWMLAGEAAEFLIKAYIMRKDGLNGWPDRELRPDLYVHSLRKLVLVAAIDATALSVKEQVAFAKAMEWRREHDYVAGDFPHKAARDMFEAIFGDPGLASWVRSRT